MKISDFLDEDSIIMNLRSTKKKGVILELINLLFKNKKVKDVNQAIQAVMEREKIGTTGIGQGVALPHGRTTAVERIVGAFGISKDGVEFNALDGEKVYLVFLLLSPVETGGEHLKALANITKLSKDKFLRQILIDAKSPQEVMKIIKENEKY